MTPRILFVYTSCDKNLQGKPTGWYLPEAAHPYYILEKNAEIDFAAPKGPNPPVDEQSVKMYTDTESQKFLTDEKVKQKFARAKKLNEINAKDYDAIFYVGGHGPVIDLAQDPTNAKLASEFWRQGKIVAAVCHGPAALVGATDNNGKSIFQGRVFTGFSNAEEENVQGVNTIPFLLEDKLQQLGGKYVKADQLWGPKVVVDGKLITGQNPASAAPLGEALRKALIGNSS